MNNREDVGYLNRKDHINPRSHILETIIETELVKAGIPMAFGTKCAEEVRMEVGA